MSYPDSVWSINDAFSAIANNDVAWLKKSIREGQIDINQENEFGETLLGTAIWLKNFEAVKFLCSLKEINVNKKTTFYLGEDVSEPYVEVFPLELAACILPKICYKSNAFLDLKTKQICAELVKRNAKMPLEKYKRDRRFLGCLRDLREVVNSVKTTKNLNKNLTTFEG